MEQLELKLESDADILARQKKKAKLMELFRQGNEASWLKFLKTDEALAILNEGLEDA